jgi:hypothetical protein
MQDGFTHGFARDGAGIYGNSTDRSHPLNYSSPLAQLIGVDGGALPRGAGTNDENVVGNHALSERVSEEPSEEINFPFLRAPKTATPTT